jgi:hypothetical protein
MSAITMIGVAGCAVLGAAFLAIGIPRVRRPPRARRACDAETRGRGVVSRRSAGREAAMTARVRRLVDGRPGIGAFVLGAWVGAGAAALAIWSMRGYRRHSG